MRHALLMLQTTETFIWSVASASSMTSPFRFAVYRWAATGAAHARANATANASRGNFIGVSAPKSALGRNLWLSATVSNQRDQKVDGQVDWEAIRHDQRCPSRRVQFVQGGAMVCEELDDLAHFGLRAVTQIRRCVHDR